VLDVLGTQPPPREPVFVLLAVATFQFSQAGFCVDKPYWTEFFCNALSFGAKLANDIEGNS
jgi:hypothetical protein